MKPLIAAVLQRCAKQSSRFDRPKNSEPHAEQMNFDCATRRAAL
jgi:hypothetical protein